MNCPPCKEQDHAHCIDIYWGPPLETGEHEPTVIRFTDGSTEADEFFIVPGRLYRSCFCQHRTRGLHPEPATGPAGE